MLVRFTLIPLCLASLIGCGAENSQGSDASSEDMAVVQSVLVDQLSRQSDDIKPSMTLSELGADALDIVEITMEIEDRLEIRIDDRALERVAGSHTVEDLPAQLTVADLVQVVTQSRVAP